MPDAWFYLENEQRIGPVDATALRRLASVGKLQPTSLVWKDGLAGWIPASRLNGLFAASQPPPPPPRATKPAAPPKANDNELVYPANISVTMTKVVNAMNMVGRVASHDPNQHRVVGAIQYGLQKVTVNASVTALGPNQSRVVFQSSSGDVWNAGAKSAVCRLTDTLNNLDNPSHKPNRLGANPLTVVAAVVVLIIGTVLFVNVMDALTGENSKSNSASDTSDSAEPSEDVAADAAKKFMRDWATSGVTVAVSDLDSRAVEAVQGAVRTIKVKGFDGNVTEVGDGTVTTFATGDQCSITEFDVAPAIDLGGAFVPMHIRLSVAKDSGKVIAVVPQID